VLLTCSAGLAAPLAGPVPFSEKSNYKINRESVEKSVDVLGERAAAATRAIMSRITLHGIAAAQRTVVLNAKQLPFNCESLQRSRVRCEVLSARFLPLGLSPSLSEGVPPS
jgi:hypothetical protein